LNIEKDNDNIYTHTRPTPYKTTTNVFVNVINYYEGALAYLNMCQRDQGRGKAEGGVRQRQRKMRD